MAEEADLEDKTEDPSQKRLDDALERGNVVKSQEVNTWFIIAGATLVLLSFSGGMGQGLTTTMRGSRLETRPCIFTKLYQRPTLRRLRHVLAWLISSSRSLVIGWCSVTIVGMIFSICRML